MERTNKHTGLSAPISALWLLLVQTQAARWKAFATEHLTGVHLYLDLAKSGYFFHGFSGDMDQHRPIVATCTSLNMSTGTNDWRLQNVPRVRRFRQRHKALCTSLKSRIQPIRFTLFDRKCQAKIALWNARKCESYPDSITHVEYGVGTTYFTSNMSCSEIFKPSLTLKYFILVILYVIWWLKVYHMYYFFGGSKLKLVQIALVIEIPID